MRSRVQQLLSVALLLGGFTSNVNAGVPEELNLYPAYCCGSWAQEHSQFLFDEAPKVLDGFWDAWEFWLDGEGFHTRTTRLIPRDEIFYQSGFTVVTGLYYTDHHGDRVECKMSSLHFGSQGCLNYVAFINEARDLPRGAAGTHKLLIPISMIPEPATGCLVLAGGLVLLRARRRLGRSAACYSPTDAPSLSMVSISGHTEQHH